MPRPTFQQCADLDPAIAALEKLARRAAPAADGDPDYRVFLFEVKPLVTTLVGWFRPARTLADADLTEENRELLRSADAYDAVYQHLAAVIGSEIP